MIIRKSATEFEITFDYNPRIVAEVKACVGARWIPGQKMWTVPLDQEDKVTALFHKYVDKSKIPELKEQISEIPPMPDLTQEDADYLQTKLTRSLFPFQGNGVAYNLLHKASLIGDDPGLGKTTQAIATVVAAKSKCVLIICPSTLKINWQRELLTVAGIKSLILTDSIKNTWQQYHNLDLIHVFITNYESLKKYFVQSINKGEKKVAKLKDITFKPCINLFDAVIIDESHKVKEGQTMASKFCMGICKGKANILLLSGTPIVNKPKDLVAQLTIMGKLNEFGGWKYFMDRYCGGDGKGATNLNELQYKLRTTCFYKRNKKEVLTDLPDKIRNIIMCEITTQSEYDKALEDLGTYLQMYKNKTDEEVEKSLRGEIMVRIQVCQNISARGKLNEAFEKIDEVLEAGEKYVLFVHQKVIAQAVLSRYPAAVSVTGASSQDERQAAVDKFQKDKNCQLIVCSIKAAGVGITLTSASRMGFIEFPWHSALADQCEDRIHRIGQNDKCQYDYMLGKDTIDERVYEIIEGKRKISNAATGTVDSAQVMLIDKLSNSLFKQP